jgi:KRAB domain-containing zinc finger protein
MFSDTCDVTTSALCEREMECKAAQTVLDVNTTNSRLNSAVNEVHNSVDCEQSRECEYECTLCDKTLKYANNLASLRKIHRDLRPFKCDKCSRTFKYKCNLTKHSFIHSNVKTFECTVCAKIFKYQGSFTSHMSLHSADTDLTCSEQLTSQLTIKHEHVENGHDLQ